jgi:hypothetical protein
MRVTRRDLDRAVERGVVSEGQAEKLWDVLSEDEERFDVPQLAYYLGAVVVFTAMGWFMSLGWERFGGVGIALISVLYAALFVGLGTVMWRSPGLRVPAGLLVTIAVCMVPLAVYGVHEALGIWSGVVAGMGYSDLFSYLGGGWFALEVSTVAAGVLALYFFRFPFLLTPVAFAVWYAAAVDLAPVLYGDGEELYSRGYQTISVVVGLLMLVGAYLVDRRTEADYSFWVYLFGLCAFWGGLTAFEGGTELEWIVYAAMNLVLVLLSVLLERRVFLPFGLVGIFLYVGHLAWELFEDSMLFPFVLSAAGLAIIALGVLYARNRDRIERAVVRAVPSGIRRLLPMERVVR